MIFRWTDEATELLRHYHGEGHSFSVIAQLINDKSRLGVTTRNACIGKANRLGLARVEQPKQKGAPRPKSNRVLETRILDRARDMKKAKPRKVAPHPFPPIRQPIEEQVAEIIFAPGPEGVGFFEQRDGLCRYPISKETDVVSFRVCGHLCKHTQPYCDEHSAIAYQPAKDRPERPQRVNRVHTSEMFFKDWV